MTVFEEEFVREVESVVVGLATYRRPELLPELLHRLIKQIADASNSMVPPAQFRIVVVDNDPEGSAHNAVASVGHDDRIQYVIEPSPGISHARNRILDEAGGSDVLVLLDDDETPHDGWLTNHLDAYHRYEADAVSGPVHAVFEPVQPVFKGTEDDWVMASGYYLGQRRVGLPTGTVVSRAATNNLLLDMHRIRQLGLRFDARFGLSGGEDSLFTGQLTQAGGKIVWCAEAVVDDLVPAVRNNRRFNLSRQFAQASSHVRVDRELAGTTLAQVGTTLRWMSIGSGQILKGIALTARGWLTRQLRPRAQGESRIAKGAGVLVGCLGFQVSPYARLRSRRRLRLGRRASRRR